MAMSYIRFVGVILFLVLICLPAMGKYECSDISGLWTTNRVYSENGKEMENISEEITLKASGDSICNVVGNFENGGSITGKTFFGDNYGHFSGNWSLGEKEGKLSALMWWDKNGIGLFSGTMRESNGDGREWQLHGQKGDQTRINQQIPKETKELEMKKGWDLDQPLSEGSVKWTVKANSWVLEYSLIGAMPNHDYTAGANFFNRDDLTKESGIDEFDGKATTKGCWTRDGTRACASFLNFGSFSTDSNGNAQVTYTVTPASGRYITQFYLRDGIIEPQNGGNVAYHTGEAYADGIEASQSM